MQKNRLGRGLDALLPGSEPVVEDSQQETAPTSGPSFVDRPEPEPATAGLRR